MYSLVAFSKRKITKLNMSKIHSRDFIPKETTQEEVTYFNVSLFRSLFVEAQLAAGWVHVLSSTYLSIFSDCRVVECD